MFCTKCGKEVAEGFQVCGYCGAPVEQQGGVNDNVQQTSTQSIQQGDGGSMYTQNNNAQMNNGQGYGQQMNNGQMYNQGYNPQMNNGQMYNQGYNPQMYNANYQNQMGPAYTGDGVTIVGFFFPFLWTLFKGLWEASLVIVVIDLIFLIPIIGLILGAILHLACAIFICAKGKRYARLHREMNVSLIQILKDRQLRGF